MDPAGVPHRALSELLRPMTAEMPVIEVTGDAGDLVIMHGRMMHAGSPNCSDRVRIIGNNCVNVPHDVLPDRDPATESAYERSLRLALAG
jgi:hypothetical protein